MIALLQGFPEVRAYGFLLASFVIASCYHAIHAATFQLPAFLLGTAILLALEGLKKATKRREQANGALQKGENTT